MILCFDTGGINALLDDADHDQKTARIVAEHTVYISALNVIEAGMTADASRRVELIRLLRRLSSNRRPLEIPNALIRRMIGAYHLRRDSVDICIDDQQDGIGLR